MKQITTMKLHCTVLLLYFGINLLTNTAYASVAGQETLIGIVGQDFIVLGADTSLSSSISLTSNNVDKIRVIIDPFPTNIQRQKEIIHRHHRHPNDQQVIAVASAGDFADSERLIGQLIGHASSMEYQHLGCDVNCVYNGNRDNDDNYGAKSMMNSQSQDLYSPAGLDAESVAHLARGMIASSLRSRGQLKTCLLVAGMVRCYQYENNPVPQKEDEIKDKSFSKRLRHQIEAGTNAYADTKHSIESNEQTKMDKPKFDKVDSSDHHDFQMNSSIRTQNHHAVLKPRLFWLDEYGSLQKVEYAVHGLASNFVLSILDRQYKSTLSKDEAIDLVMDCFRQLRKRFVINSPEPPCIKYIGVNGCELINIDRHKIK